MFSTDRENLYRCSKTMAELVWEVVTANVLKKLSFSICTEHLDICGNRGLAKEMP